MSVDVLGLLDEAAAIVARARVVHALIGGCARNAYAEPRGTKDVDFAVLADGAAYRELVRCLAESGFALATAVADPDDPEVPAVALFRDASARRIDFLIAKTPFEESALARVSETVRPGSRDIPIVTPEDLIVFKLAAGRGQDIQDVIEVAQTLEVARRALDWSYVEEWCEFWEVGDRLDRVREQLARERSED